MFMVTLSRSGLRKLGALAVCGLALVGTVVGINHFVGSGSVEASAAVTAPAKIETTQDIGSFFNSYGFEVDLTSATVDKVKVPKKWDDSFAAFNEVIRESGLDLEKYKGKTVEKWTLLCPGRSSGEEKVYTILLVYREKPVGAYLLAKPSGEVTGLRTAAETAAPLTEEEAAAAAAFGEGAETAETAAQPETAETAAQPDPAAAAEPQPELPAGEQAELDLSAVGDVPVE